MICFLTNPPFCTVQDLGRFGYRAQGVPLSGAMDAWALAMANRLVGNELQAAGLEWALAGGSLRFEVATTIALMGVAADVSVNGIPVSLAEAIPVRAGDVLQIHRLTAGRYLYLAVAGGVAVPEVLNSRSTYLPGGFGGWEGRRLRAGDGLPLGPVQGEAMTRPLGAGLGPDYASSVLRVLAGPDGAIEAWQAFLATSYAVSAMGDRTGYRLEGPPLPGGHAATAVSEPVCPGTVQLPESGQPIVLMADAPTVGGYTKLAVVIQADLPILAQKRPGERLRFEAVALETAQALWRDRQALINA